MSTRGPKLKIRLGGITAAVGLYRTDTKDLIPRRKPEKRNPDGSKLLTQKQHIYDEDGTEINGAKTKRQWTDDDGKIYENGDVTHYEDGEVVEPYQKTDTLELTRFKETRPEDLMVVDYFEVTPDGDDQVVPLYELAKDIAENGPVYGPVVFRKGYKREVAVITAEVDEVRKKFALLLRTSNSHIRLTKATDIPEIKSDVPEL
jgi:hypothetical protein